MNSQFFGNSLKLILYFSLICKQANTWEAWKYWEFLEINNLGFSTALEFQGIPNYVISRTQRVASWPFFWNWKLKRLPVDKE